MVMEGYGVMASPKYKNKPVSLKKITISLGVVLGVILIILYAYKWHQVKEDEKYLQSYLISSNTINLEMNSINNINSVLSETPNNYFIYISYTGDKDIYNFEKKLKPLIDDYSLQNSFYYLNITDIKENNKNYKKDIAKELNIDSKNLDNIPVILYFKDELLQCDGVSSIKDFEKLLNDVNKNI